MNRIQYACFALIASAFVLAGLLVMQLGGRVVAPAYAGEAIQRDNITMVTAQLRQGEEALFVLDSISERLMVYTCDAARNRFEVVASGTLTEIFARVADAPAGGAGGGRAPR